MFLLPLLAAPALAQDELTGNEITYEGGLSQSAAGYVVGKPVTISHTGGNVSVRCMDTQALTARAQYVVYGTQEGPMESMGKGIGLSAAGSSSGGSVKTRMPSRPTGVKKAEITLTVNIPAPSTAVTVTQTGAGWVQVIGCDGTVKVSGGTGGVYVSGHLASVTASAAGGDVKVVQEGDAVFKAATSISSPGNATVEFAPAQGGKLKVSAAEIATTMTVVGTNSSTLIDGDMGVAGPTITVAAKGKAELSVNR